MEDGAKLILGRGGKVHVREMAGEAGWQLGGGRGGVAGSKSSVLRFREGNKI